MLLGLMGALLTTQQGQAQYDFQEENVLKIVKTIEKQDGFRFLYRESQLANIKLSFSATSSTLIEKFEQELSPYQIALKADTVRNQIILYKKATSSLHKKIHITGQVVDAESGERLPYATVFWKENGKKHGVSTNASGVFKVEKAIAEQELTLYSSYLGYETSEVTLDVSVNTEYRGLTLRLTPATMQTPDLVVTGFSYPAGSDSLYRNYVNAGILNPLGENNISKALQSLPSVSTGPALNTGINVRGASADATQILLDGMTIYNQSHLFGLLDSFNPSALKTSGFFYDITPAQIPSSPGGTLSLLTKTGSLNSFNASIGISNTAFNGTFHGPITTGKSSWLLSGRTSYMNALNWFKNEDLITFGLNVDRPNSLSDSEFSDLQSRIVFPGSYHANFVDLHSKLYFEFENGSRFVAGAYYGADDVSQNAERLTRSFDPDNPALRFSREPVQTSNNWDNFSSSLSYKSPISDRLYSSTVAGISIYSSAFNKDDFIYNRVQQNGNGLEVFTYPLQNESVFNEIKLDQTFDMVLPQIEFTFGLSHQFYMGEYFEVSFDRPGFFTSFQSGLTDLYAQMDYSFSTVIDVHAGSRLHYYSNGDFLFYSPRLKLKFFESQSLSFGIGYSKNYQFTHRLSFYNVSSPDVWIISTEEQAPTASDYLTAGVYFKLQNHTFLQIEGYYKSLTNARLFDINAQTLTNNFDNSPWFFGNKSKTKGLEFLLKNRFHNLTMTHSYTLSEATFSNPDVLDGELFYAEWDQTHSYSLVTDVNISQDLSLFVGINWSSGVPNRLYFLQIEDKERLDPFKRVDAGVEYSFEFKGAKAEISASAYNLFNHQNDWYRELNLVIDDSSPQNRRRLSAQAVDVYDLGFQPSLNIMIRF
jgi:hypothetical protein